MKMMRKNWKDRKGVSPVIATILMVAITVVLAAVLYVMVMGFGGDSNQTPTGTLNVVKTDTGKYTVSVLSISESNILKEDVRLVITPTVDGAPTDLTSVVSGSTTVTAGDYAEFTLTAGTYTVALQYIPTSNNIASTQIVMP